MKPYIFIDSNHLAFRSYYLLGKKIGLGSQRNVSNAICYGFINTFMSLMRRFNGKKIVCCWDNPPYFRHDIYKGYKANRPPKEDEYKAAIIFCKSMLKKIGFIQLSIPGFEADDLVGIFTYLLAKKGKQCLIVTDDRDYFQLLRTNVKIYRPGKDEIYDRKKFETEYDGLKPKDIILIKSISGDRSDNILGVSGIGDKTAIRIVQKHNTWKQILNHKEEIEQIAFCKHLFNRLNIDKIKLNRKIVKIPNSQTDIYKLIEQDYIRKQDIKRIVKIIDKPIEISKRKLSRVFGEYGLKKFKIELIKGDKDIFNLLGLEKMGRST